jgi:hypothetical protein
MFIWPSFCFLRKKNVTVYYCQRVLDYNNVNVFSYHYLFCPLRFLYCTIRDSVCAYIPYIFCIELCMCIHTVYLLIVYRFLWMIWKILLIIVYQHALVCQVVMDLIGWGIIAIRSMNMVDPTHVLAVTTAFNWGFHYFISHVPSYSYFVIHFLWLTF